MTLKQLEAFYWAATSVNFLIAAERLHVSQSSLSKRIAELEASLDRRLFDRSGHRAVLTEAGELLLPHARRLLSMSDELRSLMADRSGLRGHCRFGVGESTALTWLPDLVASARADCPNLVLEPSVDIGETLEHKVDSGMLDFAVVAAISGRPAIVSRPIADVPFRWAASRDLIGDRTTLDEALLRERAVITMPPGAGATRIFDQWLSTNGWEVGRRLTCNSMAAIVGLVVAGAGLGFLPESWLTPLLRHKSLVLLDCDPPLPPLRFYLQWRRDDSRPVVALMREIVLRTVDFSKPAVAW
jgi:DNA-binding transcriptional LysR family regulator